MRFNVRNKKKRGFTLVETIATIMIYAAMLLMITNVVLVNARLSQQLKMRSRIRSELYQTMALIKRDVRNATNISCDEGSIIMKCSLTIVSNQIVWNYEPYTQLLTRTDETSGYTYSPSDIVQIESFSFFIINDPNSLQKQATLIVSLRAKGSNDSWKVNNQILQEVISTRNYGI